MQQHDELFTYTLDGTIAQVTFVTSVDWGLEKFSVMCKSDTPVTITGTRTLGAYASSAVSLSKGETFSWSKCDGLKPFTITAPIGALAVITAV